MNSLTTTEMLEKLYSNSKLKAINSKKCILEIVGDEKYINVINNSTNKISLLDMWSLIAPISYEEANSLYLKGHLVECLFEDGGHHHFRKLPINGNFIMESDLPNINNCLWYSYCD